MGCEPTAMHRSFPAVAASVPEVRRFVAMAWHRLCSGSDVGPDGDVALVISELATNAVLHAGGELDVSVAWSGPVVRIAVCDASAARPEPLDPEGSSVGGRGLRIVELLADDWGVEELDDGKAVWVEFRLA